MRCIISRRIVASLLQASSPGIWPIVAFAIETLHNRVLDRAVYPPDQAVGPRVVGFGQAVLDPDGVADHVEGHRAGMSRVAAMGLLGELGAVVGENGVDLMEHGLQQVPWELRGSFSISCRNELGESEAGCPVDTHEEKERALAGLHLCNVDVKIPDGLAFELLPPGLVTLGLGQDC